jgi:hypothetical protein
MDSTDAREIARRAAADPDRVAATEARRRIREGAGTVQDVEILAEWTAAAEERKRAAAEATAGRGDGDRTGVGEGDLGLPDLAGGGVPLPPGPGR